jgi:hypothetical protein
LLIAATVPHESEKRYSFLSRFLSYTFQGRLQRPHSSVEDNQDLEEILIEEVDIEPESQQVRNKLIITINWVLVIVCIISFSFLIAYLLLYPDKPVPDIIQNAFFTTLGWFGGALSSFFQIDKNR